MEQRFTRLRRGSVPEGAGLYVVPENGMCLSTFLIFRAPKRPGSVLLGRINPNAPWLELAALEPSRVDAIGRRWMLPASQLKFFESPADSARRISRELLESDLPAVEGPRVFSEAYGRPASPQGDPHWDLHFVFEGTWPSARPPRASPWTELAFVEVARTPRAEIARSQGDVLELVGLRPAD